MKSFLKNFWGSAGKAHRDGVRWDVRVFGLFALGCLVALGGLMLNFLPLTVIGVVILLVAAAWFGF